MKERVSVIAAAVLSLAVSMFGVLFLTSALFRKSYPKGSLETLLKTPTPKPEPLMGAVALPPRKVEPKPTDANSSKQELPIYSRSRM